jgi:hypothetical protein
MTNKSTDSEEKPTNEGQSILARIRNYARVQFATLVTNDRRLQRHPVLTTLPFPLPQHPEGETQ